VAALYRCIGEGFMAAYLFVFFGSGIGGAMRHSVNQLTMRCIGGDFPWSTLIVNIVGSFVIGVFAEYLALRGQVSQHWRLFFATGVLGGFTTFSAFSLDVVLLHERGQTVLATGYALGTVAASVGALFLGMWFIRAST
jgi:CrcB protein